MKKTNFLFSVEPTEQPQKFNDVLDIVRCRIFYKGLNRNGTYITDTFAENLVKTLPYAPIKGIYSGTDNDYTDHGAARDLGKIYGIVPQDPQFAWEKHLDEDGVEREYACANVLLFTALYKEATEIVSKGQSMELYAPSLKGHWSIVDGIKCYVIDEGCFLGLQVLGNDVEPCFEGAGFYSLQDIRKAVEILENTMFQLEQGGRETMFKTNYKLSDDDKRLLLWQMLNPNYTEEGEYEVSCWIEKVYETYAVVYYFETNSYERVYYSKNDETNEITILNNEKCYIVDVNEEELGKLKQSYELNNNSYDLEGGEYVANLRNEIATAANNLAQEVEKYTELEINYTALQSDFETKKLEYENLNCTLQQSQEENGTLKGQLNSLQAEVDEIENGKKIAEIEKYSAKLDEDTLENYKKNISDYSIDELKKDLAFSLVTTMSDTLFTTSEKLLPKKAPASGIEAILDNYEKK